MCFIICIFVQMTNKCVCAPDLSLASSPADRNHRAQVFKALGHPVRLLLVERLAEGEECVCRLTECTGLDISTISRHLGLLKQAGIVVDQKRGQQVFYSLRFQCLGSFFACIDEARNQGVAL